MFSSKEGERGMGREVVVQAARRERVKTMKVRAWCDGCEKTWSGSGSGTSPVGCAARHSDHSGHTTHVETTVTYRVEVGPVTAVLTSTVPGTKITTSHPPTSHPPPWVSVMNKHTRAGKAKVEFEKSGKSGGRDEGGRDGGKR